MKRAARQWLLLLGLFAAHSGIAQSPPARIEASEPSVKAAFLYKFAAYVDWPASAFASPEAPFVIAVMGADDVAAELERIVPGRTIHGHPALVRRLTAGDPVAGSHLLFIGRSVGNPSVALRAVQHGTLAVTDTEQGLAMGSAVNFLVADEHVGFEVSLEAAERSGVKISSRMLNVARQVVPRR
jgi:uncharacterized protein DUF4154